MRCSPPRDYSPDNRTVAGVIDRARLDDLSPRRLYGLLALRSRVFVVEQDCPYLDADGRDAEPGAEHWWDDPDGDPLAPAATLRVLVEPGGGHRIGRVVTAPEHRGTGRGDALVRAALAALTGPVVLGAQVRSAGFYARLGFVVDGPEYDEDGIPHVPMRRG